MEFLADLHVHSDNSFDGLSGLDDIALAAKKRGLHAVAVTDHNVFTLGSPEMRHGVLLLPGCEVSTTGGHVTALFCRPFDVLAMRKNGLPSVREAADAIRANGGIAVLAHPFAKKGASCEAFAPFIDGAECCNARAYFKNPGANAEAAAFAEKYALPAVGGSDAHLAREVGGCFTAVECGSTEELEDAIKAGRCRAVFVKNSPYLNKGLSQLRRRMRKKSLKNLVIGIAYIIYCALRTLFGKR